MRSGYRVPGVSITSALNDVAPLAFPELESTAACEPHLSNDRQRSSLGDL